MLTVPIQRETDWSVPNSYPIKRLCCGVRWVSMSNRKARAKPSTSYLSCRQGKGLFLELLIVGFENAIDAIDAIYTSNSVKMHNSSAVHK